MALTGYSLQRALAENLEGFFQWVKAVLIREFAPAEGAAVLDLCCGAGDVAAWKAVRAATYVGVDWNPHPLLHARRSAPATAASFACHFVEADCCSEDLVGTLRGSGAPAEYTAITCFFALQMAFDHEERARRLLANVSALLRPGGVFLGVVMDANVLVKRLRASRTMEFGNSAYRVSFADRGHKRFPREGPPVGHGFEYAVRAAATREWLVVWPYLLRLAGECGLRLRWQRNVHEVFGAFGRAHGDLWTEHRVRAPGEAEWDIAYLYKAFVFEKVEGPA